MHAPTHAQRRALHACIVCDSMDGRMCTVVVKNICRACTPTTKYYKYICISIFHVAGIYNVVISECLALAGASLRVCMQMFGTVQLTASNMSDGLQTNAAGCNQADARYQLVSNSPMSSSLGRECSSGPGSEVSAP